MSLRIVHYNNPVLRKKGERITTFDAALVKLANEMLETMYDAEGIGLAAQQIGRALQLCVVDVSNGDWEFDWKLDGAKPPLKLFMPMALANPVVATKPESTEPYEEGCLSFPKIRGDVVRPAAITVKFHDINGQPHVLECNGMLARCIQHEVDHLNGILFIDRMEKKVRSKIDDDIKALAKETRVAEKV